MTTPQMQAIVTQITVVQEGQPLFHDSATTITLDDNAAGGFVRVKQLYEECGQGEIIIDQYEWEAVSKAIGDMLVVAKEYNKAQDGKPAEVLANNDNNKGE